MTGPPNQAPVLQVTNPVTYEELTPEHQQKYHEVKAQFEADLIGSFERTHSHDIRWKGFSPGFWQAWFRHRGDDGNS